MIFVISYLAIGYANLAAYAARGGITIKPRENSHVLLKGGGTRPETFADTMPAALIEAHFLVLLWPVQLGFRWVYVPIHDYFAGRAWKRYLESDEPGWRPER